MLIFFFGERAIDNNETREPNREPRNRDRLTGNRYEPEPAWTGLSYINMVPCPGMNEHPIARMELILRQVEAPVKIYNSRWVPASIYSVKCSIIAGKGSTMKKIIKKSIFSKSLRIQKISPEPSSDHDSAPPNLQISLLTHPGRSPHDS